MMQKVLGLIFLTVPFFSGCQGSDQYASLTQEGQLVQKFSTLPYDIDEKDYQPLRSLGDPVLERELLGRLRSNPQWRQLIDNGKMAVGVVDIRDPYNARFASVNGDHMMYAASLPKIAILLAAIDAFEKGEIRETPELTQELHNMISHSSNSAATRFIDLLGYDKIESVLTDPKYALYDEDQGGGLWVGKRYAAQGERHPDPMHGLSHAATVTQVCRFYYLLAQGRLVSKERSKQMLSLMDDPELHHKFVNTLEKIAPGAKLYRKSGTWKTFHADSVLVWGSESRRYILVALIDDPSGESVIRSLVKPVESALRNSLSVK